MCKMCGTKHRKTFELLTDLSPAAWPYDDKSDCQPSRPCKSLMEAIQAGKNRRHPVRLEWDASTESATYLPGFNKELTRAIFMHHNIPLPRARK